MSGALSRVRRTDLVTPRLLEPSERDEWARLRAALWPDFPVEQLEQEMAEILQDPEREVVFVNAGPHGCLQGFLEVSLRPYAPGCKSSPVGYLEGWYVAPSVRRQGVERALVAAAEKWARSKGCREIASDADIENQQSQVAHGRLGYEEVERVVHFRKAL